jgi:methanogenic corrinoid protein MtbC1
LYAFGCALRRGRGIGYIGPMQGGESADDTQIQERGRDLRDRYLAAQLRGDRRQALQVITDEGPRAGLSPAQLSRVIGDAQREIGRLWQEDRISVAEEHIATAISHMALSFVYQLARPGTPNGKKVLVACVEGELHEFPARIAADALDLAGFEVRFLGASVPTDSLLSILDKDAPDLLALSVTMSFHVPAAREAVRRVREHTGGRLPIALGGGACEWSKNLATELAVEVTGCDADELVRAAARQLGVER